MSVTMRGPVDTFISRQRPKLYLLSSLTRYRMAGSHALLQSPWLKCTVESFNGSPITHLEFEHCTEELVNALPLFSLPRLSRLSVEDCHLPMSVLAAFLSRHPKIVTLKVSSLQQDIRIKANIFPSVRSLHCDALTLSHLLAKRAAFPCLHDIYVSDLMTYDTTFITKIFKYIRRTRVSYLCTPLKLSASQKMWLQFFRQPARRRELAAVQLPSITTISSHQDDVGGLMVDLPLWFLIFPNVHKLRIDSSSSEQSRSDKLTLMEDIIEKYPQIHVVVIDGIGGTLEDWRCGKEQSFESPRSDRSLTWSLKFGRIGEM
jgi:hypothetical protein